MTRQSENLQRSLFDEEGPRIELQPTQRAELEAAVEALRLLSAICDQHVGAVLAIEASRLARNGRDWHTLIEFCGLVGTVIVDEDGISDVPSQAQRTR